MQHKVFFLYHCCLLELVLIFEKRKKAHSSRTENSPLAHLSSEYSVWKNTQTPVENYIHKRLSDGGRKVIF